jgi:xanthine dehydrogenase accessory factor
MKQLLETIRNLLSAGESAMLLTIIERDGSAPRGVGTSMVISMDGDQIGTIGGGTVEYQARQDALHMLGACESGTREYLLYADESDGAGMVCGGRVRVLFRCFSGSDGPDVASHALNMLKSGESAYLVTAIRGEKIEKAEVLANGQAVQRPEIAAHLGERAVLTEEDEAQWFIVPLQGVPRVIVFGGGHVAQKMAPLLSFIDYRVWVLEDREAFAKQALFPTAERVLHIPFDKAETKIDITNRDHVIVLTRGHQSDVKILRRILRSKADYIGCIGSRTKVKLTRERLICDGFSEADLNRLHSPIGLPIGAETPAEIAVSVAAELIQYTAQKRGTIK